jgi:hypothetical protein
MCPHSLSISLFPPNKDPVPFKNIAKKLEKTYMTKQGFIKGNIDDIYFKHEFKQKLYLYIVNYI